MDLACLPGFRDFFPEEAAKRDYIFRCWRETALRYGFQAYDGPPLEPTDLYRRKSGDEIVGQLYCFIDKGDRDISLRPEMTPTLARMVASKGNSLPKPIKWFSIPQLFRYERQQRGRLREHFQFNCDILGETSVMADAELVALLIDTLRRLGLKAEDFRVRVSDRQLLAALIGAKGISSESAQKTVFACVDKLTRETPEVVERRMVEGGLSADEAKGVLSLFQQRTLSDLAGEFDADEQVSARILALQEFFGALEGMGLKDFVEFDLTIVRGLAYYTGIVFEAFDRKGEFRAISGGGRYDHLLETIGGVSMPALGFGMGDVVLGELLTQRGLWPADLHARMDVYCVVVEESVRGRVLALAHQLRDAGLRVDYPLTAAAVGKQFKLATQRGATHALVAGPDELKRGAVKVKNLQTREEQEIPVDKLAAHLLAVPSRGC
jgi:histidyl-tRNA synthetase